MLDAEVASIKMQKKIKIIVLVLLVGSFSTTIYLYRQYEKQATADVARETRVTKTDATAILTSFKNDEGLANDTFVERVVEVEGVVEKISFLNERHTIMLKSDDNTKNYVICDMMPMSKNHIDRLNIGDTVVVRGVCKGYLFDVVMLNCVPINNNIDE